MSIYVQELFMLFNEKKNEKEYFKSVFKSKMFIYYLFFVIFFHIYDTKFSLKDDIDISSFITFVKTIRNK